MGLRYYNKTNQPGSELFLATPIAHLLYVPALPDHVAIDDGNVFWSPVPAGQQFTYTSGIPDGLEPIPAPIYTAEEQARIDLAAAGVNNNTVSIALLADHRSIPGLLAAIDAAIDIVVISSGLTLAQVTGLI